MSYQPKRTARFDHVGDLLAFLEERQCHDCVFRNLGDEEFPMCLERSGPASLEEAIEEWEEVLPDVVVCHAWQEG